MAFVSDLFDTLRDLLNDPADSQVTHLTKRLYLNKGIARLWPQVYSVKTLDVSMIDSTYEYALPVVVTDGYILSIEANTLNYPTLYTRYSYYDVIPGDEDLAGKLVVFGGSSTGVTLRIRYAAPVPLIVAASYVASQSELWAAPDRAMSLPAHYAMAMITSRKVDDRQDTLRYSTTQASNGVSDDDIMAASQMWMGQFELELAAFERPLPPAVD